MKTNYVSAARASRLSFLDPFARAILIAAVIVSFFAFPAAAQTPDYGPGIKKFFDLGLPQALQAKYVKIESRGGFDFDRFGGGRGPKLTGNAWLLEERPDGTAKVLVDEVRIAELIPAKIMEQRMKERMEKYMAKAKAKGVSEEDLEPDDDELDDMSPDASTIGGSWKEADLKADVQTLLDYVNKVSEARDYEFRGNAPKYFFFAAHVHSRGLTTEANQLIGALFQKAGDSRKLLGAAMNEIAEVEYAKAFKTFNQSGDWRQYLSAMEGLTAKFATAWRNGPVIERVAGMVRAQLEQKTLPEITGANLTAEDKHIAELLGATNTVLSMNQGLFNGIYWLAQEPPVAKPGAKEPTDPLQLIQRRGVPAIPLLVALLKDTALVRTKSYSYTSRSYSDDADPLSPEEIEQLMDTISRPVSRGEIARKILEPLVMSRFDETRFDNDNKLTTEDLAKKATAWYEAHKGYQRSDLPRKFLAEGHEEILGLLLSSNESEDRAVTESYLLNTNRLAQSMQYVTQYAQIHGDSAKSFVQKYVAEVKKLPSLVPKRETMQMDAEYVKQREEQARSQLKALEEMMTDKTLDQTLEEMLASNEKWNSQNLQKSAQILTAKINAANVDKAVTMLLQSAIKAKDNSLSSTLLQIISSLRWIEMRAMRASRSPNVEPQEHKFKLETDAELWKTMLAQDRPAPNRQMFGGGEMSHKQYVAYMIEALYGNVQELQMRGSMESAIYLGPKLNEIYFSRAQARLAGKAEADLPGFPDKSRVTPERKAQLRQMLQGSTAENQCEIAGKINLDELVSLPELTEADVKLNEKLVPASHRIEEVSLTLNHEPITKILQPLKGHPLDRKSLEALIEASKQLAAQGTNFMITVSRSVPLEGVKVDARSFPANGASRSRSSRGGNQVSMNVVLHCQSAEGLQSYLQIPVKLARPPEPKAGKKTDDDLLTDASDRLGEYLKEQTDDFWEKFGKLFKPEVNACAPYSVAIYVMGNNSMEIE